MLRMPDCEGSELERARGKLASAAQGGARVQREPFEELSAVLNRRRAIVEGRTETSDNAEARNLSVATEHKTPVIRRGLTPWFWKQQKDTEIVAIAHQHSQALRELSSKYQEAMNKRGKLEQQYEDLKQELTQVHSSEGRLREEVTSARMTEEELKQEVTRLQSAKEKLREDLAEAQRMEEELQLEVTVARTKEDELRQEVMFVKATEEELKLEVARAQMTEEELRQEVMLVRATQNELEQELAHVRAREEELEEALAHSQRTEQSAADMDSCSLSHLRAAMTRGGVSTDELEASILSVEAFVGEARRELQNRRLRERRAAFERLHATLAQDDETMLQEAIAEAKRANVEQDDVQKAEAALQGLQALTPEQRAAKAAKAREAESKRQAFLFVKRDDVVGLEELLAEIDVAGLQWQSWKDHARRTLLQCASSLRSVKTHQLLEARFKAAVPPIDPPVKITLSACMQAKQADDLAAELERTLPEVTPREKQDSAAVPQSHLKSEAAEDVQYQVVAKLVDLPVPEEAVPEMTPEVPTPTKAKVDDDENAKVRVAAFRAVVKDDTATLAEVLLSHVEVDVWKHWMNKAGKDLLTLAEERGSVAAYSMLGRALGLLKERKRDIYEEREAVWVMAVGDVQPRRATVIEDTPAEADTVLLEYWDGVEPPTMVDRDFVLKSS